MNISLFFLKVCILVRDTLNANSVDVDELNLHFFILDIMVLLYVCICKNNNDIYERQKWTNSAYERIYANYC